MTPLRDLAAGLMLLTRLPVAAVVRPAASPAGAVWSFPIVGALVGLLAGVLFRIADRAHLPPVLAAVWTVAAMLLLTGGLHEDGLADTADGLGGGTTREAKLAIMRDSRIGSFGALALIVSISVRTAGIAALPPGRVLASLIAVGAVARALMVLPILLLPAARPDGLAKMVGAGPRSGPWLALLIAAVFCCGVLPIHAAVVLMLSAGLAAWAMSAVAMRQLGGYTGDILGAVEQLGECVALTALAVA